MSAHFRLSFYKLYLLLSIFGVLIHLYTIMNIQNEDNDPRIQSVFSKNWNQLQRLYNRSKHPSLKGIKYEQKMQLAKTFYNGLKSETNWKRSSSDDSSDDSSSSDDDAVPSLAPPRKKKKKILK
eukprot:293431_1